MNNKNFTPILDVNVSVLTYKKVIRKIEEWIVNNKKEYICVAAVHLVMECQRDENLLKGVNKAGLVTPDGMPLVWILKLKGKKDVERVYGPDLMLKMCRFAQGKGYKIFLLGGAKGESRILARKLKEKFPKLKIVGFKDTLKRPLLKKENKLVIDRINQSRADIVFVGMGCPFQELWIIENRRKLKANVLIGVGVAFDFITGRVRQAPKFIQNIGLEWFFRLLQEPGRLWYRYTVLNLMFIYLCLKRIGFNIKIRKK